MKLISFTPFTCLITFIQKFTVQIRVVTFILACSSLTGCKKDTSLKNDNSSALYTSPCSVDHITWMPDNESVIMETHCESTQYIVNTSTKQVRNWSVSPFAPQHHYSTPEIPQKLFFISVVPGRTGFPLAVYALNVNDLSVTLVKDSINDNPLNGYFFFAGKKLAVRDNNTQTNVINLETGVSQKIINTGDVQGWSPDNSRLLFYPRSQPISNASFFDFSCNCTQSILLSGNGRSIWRPQGIIGMDYRPRFLASDTLLIENRQSGALLKSFPKHLDGPWYAPGSDLLFIYIETTSYPTDYMGELISYNPFNGEIKSLAKAKNLVSGGISSISLSPDQTRIAYIQDGVNLNIIRL